MRLKRALIVLLGVAVVLAIGLFIWARSVLTGDAVRAAVEAQLTKALGQPVSIGSVSATILPRVTMSLGDVAIGQPKRITVRRLDVGTDFRALLSRRIEHGSVRLAGARLELPLPALALGGSPPAGAPPRAAPVQIVSIDAVQLDDLEIVSGGRTLHGSLDLVPAGLGVTVRRASLSTDDTAIEITGSISDLAGPTGELTATAKGINVLDLVEFAEDFSKGAGFTNSASPSARDDVPMDLRIDLETDRAMVGTLALTSLAGRARITPDAVTLEPVGFGVFDGAYTGGLAWALNETQAFHITGSVQKIDVAAAVAFAGSSDAITGRLGGTIDITGRGVTGDDVVATARGRARVDVRDGSVVGLGLVRTIVLAGSMRKESQAAASAPRRGEREPFSELSATFAVSGGRARTTDLRFTSKDVLMNGVGEIGLRDASVEFAGPVQLSDALTQQAGRDLVRYTKVQGRATVPITISGTAGSLRVGIDAGEVMKRAITNRAEEEAKKALKKALGKIIK